MYVLVDAVVRGALSFVVNGSIKGSRGPLLSETVGPQDDALPVPTLHAYTPCSCILSWLEASRLHLDEL